MEDPGNKFDTMYGPGPSCSKGRKRHPLFEQLGPGVFQFLKMGTTTVSLTPKTKLYGHPKVPCFACIYFKVSHPLPSSCQIFWTVYTSKRIRHTLHPSSKTKA